MKRYTAFVLLLCWSVAPEVSVAREAWLLLHDSEHGAIYRAQDGAMRQVARVGGSVTYGETQSALAVISRRSPTAPLLLQLIDKKTQTTTATWPLEGFSVLQLSGPSRDVALTDKSAYYVSIRYRKDASTLEPNELGGQFDLYRVSLADGKLQRFPLAAECVNPRLTVFNGAPLVYSWNGYGVWQFDAAGSKLDALVLRRDLDDTMVAQGANALTPTMQPRFADYVALPQVGVFRISRLGGLKRVLDASLMRNTVAVATLDLNQKGNVVRALAATADGKPAVGLVMERQGALRQVPLRYVAIDPLSMTVLREIPLPEDAILDSVTVARDGSLVFVDRRAAAIRRIAQADSEMLWSIQGQIAGEYLEYSRIISFDP
jgi:hypothetical protein